MSAASTLTPQELSRLLVVALAQSVLAREQRQIAFAGASHRAVARSGRYVLKPYLAKEERNQRSRPLLIADLAGKPPEFFGVILARPRVSNVQPGQLIGDPKDIAGLRFCSKRKRFAEVGGGGVITCRHKFGVAAFVVNIPNFQAGIPVVDRESCGAVRDGLFIGALCTLARCSLLQGGGRIVEL